MAHTIAWCLSVIEPLIKSISLILFDRGFYSKELMLTLAKTKHPYLIFVPINSKIRGELDDMKKNERKTMQHKFELNKNKTLSKGKQLLHC